MYYTLQNRVLSSFRSGRILNGSISGEYDSGEYIFDVITTADNNILSSASDYSVSIHNGQSLQVISKINAHSERISSIESSRQDSNILCTGSEDKTAKIWDLRQQQLSIAFNFEDEVYSASFGLDSQLLAIGSGTTVFFHDIRKVSLKPLGQYSDVHTDLITQVKFHPKHPTILASSSEDCLISIFDVSVESGEDAVVSIMNTESPVRKFGFFGVDDVGIYSLSSVETLSLWHHPSAQRISKFDNIRDEFSSDYLVDCLYSNESDSLALISGKYDGNLFYSNVEPNRITPLFEMKDGHNAQVRCATSTQDKRVITGGEDSRICSWIKCDKLSQSTHSESTRSLGQALALSGKKSIKSIKHKPY